MLCFVPTILIKNKKGKMKKKTLSLGKKPNKTIQIKGESIQVKPYISFEDQILITEGYITTLYSANTSLNHRRIAAEYTLIVSIVDLCTSISIDSENFYDNVVAAGVWDTIKSNILNYDSFRDLLKESVEHVEKSTSLTSTVNNLVNTIIVFLDNLSGMDVSPEGIEKLSGQFGELTGGLKEIQETLGQSPETSK